MLATKSRTGGFLTYIHFFRGLAILLIVAVHTLLIIPWGEHHLTKTIFYGITNNGTVLFVFIAGFLFQYLNTQKFRYGSYLYKKLKYVVLPYIIVSIPVIIEKLYFDEGTHWWMNDTYHSYPDFVKVLYMLVTGRQFGPFWFIPMIIIYYLISPILLKWGSSKISRFLTPIIVLASLSTVWFGYYAPLWASFIHFLPIYLLGQWCATYKDSILAKKWLFMLGLVFYTSMTLLEIVNIIPFDSYMELRDSGTPFFVLNLSKLKAIILCITSMQLFYILRNRRIFLLKLAGDYSFGIFFIHLYVINIFLKFNLVQYFSFAHIAIAYILLFLLVSMVTIVIVYVIKLIFGSKSRILIGS